MQSIAVFSGSAIGHDATFAAAARAFGAELGRRGLRLVYGGAARGLMGTVADAALAAGGEVVGVIPEWLVEREVAHRGVTELVTVGSMHERKAEMADRADAAVALPGGLGTLDELFEMWTWRQLGLHDKPIGMLNVGGYFDPLLGFLAGAVAQGFVRPLDRDALVVSDTAEVLLDRLASE